MSDNECDRLLAVGTKNLEPLPPLRVISNCAPLPRDGVHRVVSENVVKQLCPSSRITRDNIRRLLKSNPAMIALGKEFFLSAQTLSDQPIHSGTEPYRCGLAECQRYIRPSDPVSYVSIAYPECHTFAHYPFLPASDFPSSKGLKVCHFHGLISLMPRKIAFLEPTVSKVPLFMSSDCVLILFFQPPSVDAAAGNRFPAAQSDEDASSASPSADGGLHLPSKNADDKNDSGVGIEKNAPLSPDDMFAKETL